MKKMQYHERPQEADSESLRNPIQTHVDIHILFSSAHFYKSAVLRIIQSASPLISCLQKIWTSVCDQLSANIYWCFVEFFAFVLFYMRGSNEGPASNWAINCTT